MIENLEIIESNFANFTTRAKISSCANYSVVKFSEQLVHDQKVITLLFLVLQIPRQDHGTHLALFQTKISLSCPLFKIMPTIHEAGETIGRKPSLFGKNYYTKEAAVQKSSNFMRQIVTA